MPIERAPIDLRAVIEHVVDEALVSASDGRIETTLEGDLRGAWDASRLEQLFSNLLVNALRHGAPDAPVVLRAVGSGDHVTFTLTNGGAIASALLPNLFDPFRSDRTRRAGTVGLGLGLYIVQQIVVAHGGSIEVRSNEAEGTTFRVVLLRDAGATSVAAPGSGDPLAGLATSRFAPESIERSEVRREALRDST
jgi:signal transduction histidine kinase